MINKLLYSIRTVFQIWREQVVECPKLAIYEAANGIVHKLNIVMEVCIPAQIVNIIAGDKDIRSLLCLIIIYALSISILGFLDKSINLLQDAYGYQSINLRLNKINQKAMSMDYVDTENAEVWDMVETAKDGVWEFNDVGYTICTDLLGNIFSLVIMCIIFCELSPAVFVLSVLLTLFSTYTERKKIQAIHNYQAKESESKRRLNYCKDLLRDQSLGKEVRIYDAVEYIHGKYHEAHQQYVNIFQKRELELRKWSLWQRVVYFFQLIMSYSVAINRFQDGAINIGSFLMYTNASKELFFVVQDIFDNFVDMLLVIETYNDYLKFMTRDNKLENTEKKEDIPDEGAGIIEFKDVSFVYPSNSKAVIKNVSFKIAPGDRIAFVGDNGAGKTTIIKLLLRLYEPTSGNIFLNGKDIRKYDYREYQNMFSCAFQDFKIYEYSLKENICFDVYEETRLQNVLNSTLLGSIVEKCANGLNTPLGRAFDENGVDLSGGEKQIVAIARAIYKEGVIMIFDEPTAALDPIREKETYNNIVNCCDKKTMLFISHRMGSTDFCNKIFVLENGALIEEGDHNELMDKKGVYYDLYEQQAQYYK